MKEAEHKNVEFTPDQMRWEIINHKVHVISVEFLTFTTVNVTLDKKPP